MSVRWSGLNAATSETFLITEDVGNPDPDRPVLRGGANSGLVQPDLRHSIGEASTITVVPDEQGAERNVVTLIADGARTAWYEVELRDQFGVALPSGEPVSWEVVDGPFVILDDQQGEVFEGRAVCQIAVSDMSTEQGLGDGGADPPGPGTLLVRAGRAEHSFTITAFQPQFTLEFDHDDAAPQLIIGPADESTSRVVARLRGTATDGAVVHWSVTSGYIEGALEPAYETTLFATNSGELYGDGSAEITIVASDVDGVVPGAGPVVVTATLGDVTGYLDLSFAKRMGAVSVPGGHLIDPPFGYVFDFAVLLESWTWAQSLSAPPSVSSGLGVVHVPSLPLVTVDHPVVVGDLVQQHTVQHTRPALTPLGADTYTALPSTDRTVFANSSTTVHVADALSTKMAFYLVGNQGDSLRIDDLQLPGGSRVPGFDTGTDGVREVVLVDVGSSGEVSVPVVSTGVTPSDAGPFGVELVAIPVHADPTGAMRAGLYRTATWQQVELRASVRLTVAGSEVWAEVADFASAFFGADPQGGAGHVGALAGSLLVVGDVGALVKNTLRSWGYSGGDVDFIETCGAALGVVPVAGDAAAIMMKGVLVAGGVPATVRGSRWLIEQIRVQARLDEAEDLVAVMRVQSEGAESGAHSMARVLEVETSGDQVTSLASIRGRIVGLVDETVADEAIGSIFKGLDEVIASLDNAYNGAAGGRFAIDVLERLSDTRVRQFAELDEATQIEWVRLIATASKGERITPEYLARALDNTSLLSTPDSAGLFLADVARHAEVPGLYRIVNSMSPTPFWRRWTNRGNLYEIQVASAVVEPGRLLGGKQVAKILEFRQPVGAQLGSRREWSDLDILVEFDDGTTGAIQAARTSQAELNKPRLTYWLKIIRQRQIEDVDFAAHSVFYVGNVPREQVFHRHLDIIDDYQVRYETIQSGY
ncbi:MAG: hypothetical protein AAGI30_01640 [Planctomycetota bacterium]